MGLDIVVGEIPYYSEDDDDEEGDFQLYQERQYEAINSVLRKAGLTTHYEPTEPQGSAPGIFASAVGLASIICAASPLIFGQEMVLRRRALIIRRLVIRF